MFRKCWCHPVSPDTAKINPGGFIDKFSNILFKFSDTETKCMEEQIKNLKNVNAIALFRIGTRILKVGSPVLRLNNCDGNVRDLDLGVAVSVWHLLVI